MAVIPSNEGKDVGAAIYLSFASKPVRLTKLHGDRHGIFSMVDHWYLRSARFVGETIGIEKMLQEKQVKFKALGS